MLDLVRDLYAHQEWADALHWRAVRGSGTAREDAELKARLVHIHGAQQIWLGRWQGVRLGMPGADDYGAMEDAFHFAQACHAALRAFLSLQREADMEKDIAYTYSGGDSFTQPLGDLMLHVAFHSHYHRGQNAARLRALGVPPPDADLVVWQRTGRPGASWT